MAGGTLARQSGREFLPAGRLVGYDHAPIGDLPGNTIQAAGFADCRTGRGSDNRDIRVHVLLVRNSQCDGTREPCLVEIETRFALKSVSLKEIK